MPPTSLGCFYTYNNAKFVVGGVVTLMLNVYTVDIPAIAGQQHNAVQHIKLGHYLMNS